MAYLVINPLVWGSDLKTIRVHREPEIGTAAARVYYKRSLVDDDHDDDDHQID